MRRSSLPIWISGLVLACPVLAVAQVKTFYMDEGTHYSDISMCKNADLNTVTSSLAAAMRGDGWTGSRYVNELAWPQDYWDKNLNAAGLDALYGDAATLTVFAGHGNAGLLTFRPRNGSCTAVAASTMALGHGSSGGKGTVGMWLSCDMFNTGLLDEASSSYRMMNLRQSLGWINTIGIGDDEPRDFYTATRTMANKDAWLRQMQGDGRQPLVLTATTASDAATCWFFHDREALGQGVVDLLWGDWGYRCWEWIEYD
jgi:hypothetical protein